MFSLCFKPPLCYKKPIPGIEKEFAEAEILPYIEEYEREERYPTELIAKLPPLGLLGPMIPEEYGGSFSDVVSYGVICEELARVDWVVASVVSVANSLVAGSLLKHGAEDQKQKYLPGIAKLFLRKESFSDHMLMNLLYR